MFGRLEEGWLLIADRGFYNWPDWRAAAATGATLLWRVKADLRLPVLELLPDGSYLSAVARPSLHDKALAKLIAAARAGEHLDPAQAMRVRVIEYEIGDRDRGGGGELIVLITTITDPAAAFAQELAQAYCQRWEEETGNDQLSPRNLNPARRHRSYPRLVRRARHNSYRVKRPGDAGTRYHGPPTIKLVNLPGPCQGTLAVECQP